VLIDWSSSFDAWLERLEAQADAGRPDAQERLDIVLAQLHYLEELKEAPRRTRRPCGGCGSLAPIPSGACSTRTETASPSD